LQCSSFTIGHLLELAAPETLLPKNGAAAAVSVGHGGCGEFVFGQDRGDRGVEMGGVVEVFDVGAVDAEDVVDPGGGQVLDDESQPRAAGRWAAWWRAVDRWS